MPTFKLTDAKRVELDADLLEGYLSTVQFRDSTIDQDDFQQQVDSILKRELGGAYLLSLRSELITRGVIELVSS